MTVTAVFQRQTGNVATFLLAQDGGMGTTLVIANSTLLTALGTGKRGSLFKAFNATYAVTTAAVQAVVGGGVVQTIIQPRTAAASGGATEDGYWACFADSDAVTTTKPELNIAAGVLACDAWLYLVFDHSMTR